MAIRDFPIIDWSPLGQIPQSYAQGQARAREEEFRRALSVLPTGAGGMPDYNQAISLALRSGNLNAVSPLAAIVEAQARRQQSQAALAETARHHRASEGIARQGRLPPGWRMGASGQMEFEPGGPADPQYIAQTTEARAKPRTMSLTDIGKLSEEGGKLADLTGFIETWRPQFGGYRLPAAGQAATFAGRFLPEGMVGKDVAEGATWWQSYDRYKGVVRNELYGASLTPGEKASFEAADVNPGMDPVQIEKNLGRQKLIVTNGLKRKANAAIAAGYDAETIAAAYGLNLDQLGVSSDAKRPSSLRERGSLPSSVQHDDQDIVDARTAIARGRISRAEAERRLRAAGKKFHPSDLDL